MSKSLKPAQAIAGDHNAICDRCGFRFKASELRKTWNNLYVDDACWEEEHPSDEPLKLSRDTQPVPFIRKDGAADFSNVPSAIEAVDDDMPTPTFPTTGTL